MVIAKKIFVTGSSGFVGQNLIPYLKNFKYDLHSLIRNEITSSKFSLPLGVYGIIHLAGKAHDLKKSSNSEEYYTVNFELTKIVYDAFLKSDAKKFIFISSVKASSDTVQGVLTEDMVPNPLTHYGRSKQMAEEYIQSQILPDGKSYYILRPCMIHGPGNKGNLNLLYKFVKKGIPYPLAAFNNQRSFLSIENLCFLIHKFLEKDVMSGIFNVADDEPLSTNEVVKILAESLNRKPKLLKIPSTFIRFIAKIGDTMKMPLNTERLNKLTENYIVDNRKIKEILDVNLPLSSFDGLKSTAESFRIK